MDELHVGLKGTMNALFLRDLAAKIKRGQKGRIASGFAAGGLSYGYRVVRKFDERGEPIRGLREIDEEQAEVLRRIFREYASGLSSRMIAAGLNRDGIPSPFGGEWGASTINGNLKRRSGILQRGLYRLIGFQLHPDGEEPRNRKRLSRPNPPEEWQVVEAPHLRIIDDELWDIVQARKKSYGGMRKDKTRRPKHMFSGLLRCGCCGDSFTVKSKDQLGCSAHRDKGTCDNGRVVRVADLERRVIEGIKRQFLSPDAVRKYVEEYHIEHKRLRAEAQRGRIEIEKKIGALKRQIDNIVNAIADGMATSSMKSKLLELDPDKDRLEAHLAHMDQSDNVVVLHPASPEAYRRMIADLERRSPPRKPIGAKQPIISVRWCRQ